MTTYVIDTGYTEPPSTMNDVRRGSGGRRGGKAGRGHWSVQRADHGTVAEAVGWAARAAKVPPLHRCVITLLWLRPGQPRADNDGLAVFLKAAQDGLVHAGVLADDRCQIVVEARMRIIPGVPAPLGPRLLLVLDDEALPTPIPAEWLAARP